MIAIFLNDTFYLIDNMNMQEVMAIANNEGLSSPKIRAKAVMQLNTEFYNSAMIKGYLPSISVGFYEKENSYTMKPIMGEEDLEYFIGPDGRRYTCADAYHSSRYRFVGVNQEDKSADELGLGEEVTVEGEQDEEEVVLGEATEETREDSTTFINPNPQFITPPAQESVALVPVGRVVEAEAVDCTEKIEEAKFLDGFLSKYPHLSMYVKEDQLRDVSAYLDECQDDLYREVKRPFLEEAGVLGSINGNLGNDTVENALGSSNDMLDSLLTFPVFSSLVGKKKRGKKFSMFDVDGAQFIRICPVGVNEDGQLYGFVHMIEVNFAVAQKMEADIKLMLKNSGQNYSKLTADEKYKLFEEKLSEYYIKNSGKMLRASGSQKYVDIVEFLKNLQMKKYKVTNPYDEENGQFLWDSYETIAFDNRGSKSLKEQLQEKTDTVRPVEKVEAQQVTAVVPPVSEGLKFFQANSQATEGAPSVIALPPSTLSSEKTEEEVQSAGISVQGGDALLASLANLTGGQNADNISVYDGSGSVIESVSVSKPKPIVPPKGTPGVNLADVVVPGSITMGGVDPLKPKGYVDENGIKWESEEAKRKILEAIFGPESTEEKEKGKGK